MLAGKKILLGVCGSIAAYKAAMLTRLLMKAGAEVQVVMTEAAQAFITPLTLATLSKRPVLSAFTVGQEGVWNNHVELGLWADVMLVAPTSADTLASAAHGQCPNLLLATYLSARCPVVWCPAMDLDMYAHPSTQSNLNKLRSYGNHVIEAREGELASGLSGQGRLAEPEEIVEWLAKFFGSDQGPLAGKQVVITAGPTQEPIDPVRYIGNRSSGKTGIALAEAAASMGASVTLIMGPTHHRPHRADVRVVSVTTAENMLEACQQEVPNADIAIFSAAVADYRPEHAADQKVKKAAGEPILLNLVENPDVAATMGKQKKASQVFVGYALETQNGVAYAQAKLHKKNMDFVVLNSPFVQGGAFGSDENEVSFVTEAEVNTVPRDSKANLARLILEKAASLLATKSE